MLNFIKKNWSNLADKLAGKTIYWYKSPSGILLFQSTKIALSKHCKDSVIDVGAGRLSYRSLIENFCTDYKSIDFTKTHPSLDFVGNAQNMEVLKNSSFDTVFCSQVLEHVPEPKKVFQEIQRILKPGGKAIITVPFLGYLHNEPNDFFRYTKHSLRFMSEKVGLDVVEISEVGGFFPMLDMFGQRCLRASLLGFQVWPLLLWL